MSWWRRTRVVRALLQAGGEGAPDGIHLPPVSCSASHRNSHRSQAFDRARGGIERNWNPDWKLTDLKSILNDWHVNLPRLGGWMSN